MIGVECPITPREWAILAQCNIPSDTGLGLVRFLAEGRARGHEPVDLCWVAEDLDLDPGR